jgi:hypothetical protein
MGQQHGTMRKTKHHVLGASSSVHLAIFHATAVLSFSCLQRCREPCPRAERARTSFSHSAACCFRLSHYFIVRGFHGSELVYSAVAAARRPLFVTIDFSKLWEDVLDSCDECLLIFSLACYE